jgi:curli biogenesis system outer membrane secretion channel CsgG
MRPFLRALSLAAAVCTIVTSHPTHLAAQGAAPADSAPRYPSIPRSQRPAVIVMGFEFNAALSDEDRQELNSLGALVSAMKNGDGTSKQQMSNDNLGRGVADMLMADLLASTQFRVMERKAVEQVVAEQNLTSSDRAAVAQSVAQKAKLLGAQYLITGAITQMGHEKNQKGGALGRFGGRLGAVAGALATSKDNYNIALTARVVDAATGEVVASLTSTGTSEGGRSFGLGGLGGAAGGMFGSSTSGDREKRIGQAMAAAVVGITDGLVKKRTSGDIEGPKGSGGE